MEHSIIVPYELINRKSLLSTILSHTMNLRGPRSLYLYVYLAGRIIDFHTDLYALKLSKMFILNFQMNQNIYNSCTDFQNRTVFIKMAQANTLAVGTKFPQLALAIVCPLGNGEYEIKKDQDSLEFFAGKKTVIVSIPGAFTPTCTATHIPGFMEHFQAFTDKGVNVVALSVNDAFVVQAFVKSLNLTFPMIADGSGILTKALGAETDLIEHGLGIRGRRFSIVVDNDTISHVNDEGGPGYTDISKAETVLAQL